MRKLVSVIVNNFNYEQYLRFAVESALGQDYAPVEVLVVDDGSTDGSRSVLSSYAGRIQILYKENGGQASAMNAGFAASRGEIVLFLDADDYLHPNAVSAVVAAWDDACAKVQFRLSVVDRNGVRLGVDPPPSAVMPCGDVVPDLLTTGWYTTPVTSGNAYARSVLARLLPIPEDDFRISADGYLNVLSPFYGPVVSIDEELGAYRHHGANRWAYSKSVPLDRIRAKVEHDLLKERYVEATARARGREVLPGLSLRSFSAVLQRLVSLRLDRAHHPVPSDRVANLVRAGVPALRRSDEVGGPVERLFYLAVLVGVAVLPRPVAGAIARWVLAGGRRPDWVRLLARAVRRPPSRRRTRSAAGGRDVVGRAQP